MLAVERVEILKDGAAAIYGSEAVAGVANFINRRGFEGVEVQAEARGRVGGGSLEDFSFDAVAGGTLGEDGIERPAAGTVSIMNVAFINADRIETAGVDLSAQWRVDTDRAEITGWAEATWLARYDVTNAGVEVDGLGKLNRANVGAPNQGFRGAAAVTWLRDRWSVTALVRHVGGYEDDAGGDIERFTTLDLNVRQSFGRPPWGGEETWVAFGAANVLDENPPLVNIAGSYDPRSADPRGRRLFVSVGWRR